MIEKIEEIILNTLKDKFDDFEVDSFPIKFEDYTFTSPVGCVLLRFENRDYSVQNTVYGVNGEAESKFTIFFALRYPQKHNEAYELLDELEEVLIGLNIMNRKLTPDKLKFEAEINGDIWYSFTVSINFPYFDSNKNLNSAAEELDTLFDDTPAVQIA